jgi:hypothetical protein
MDQNQAQYIAYVEKKLLKINRALPCADVRNGLSQDEYKDLLLNQFYLFRSVADNPKPIFVFMLDEVPDDICVLCSNEIKEGDQVSIYGCNEHYVHSYCMQNYLHSGLNTASRCPFCRNNDLQLYPVKDVDDEDLESIMDMEEEPDNDDVVFLGSHRVEDPIGNEDEDEDVVYLGMNLNR